VRGKHLYFHDWSLPLVFPVSNVAVTLEVRAMTIEMSLPGKISPKQTIDKHNVGAQFF
jgi:hypothetical protein